MKIDWNATQAQYFGRKLGSPLLGDLGLHTRGLKEQQRLEALLATLHQLNLNHFSDLAAASHRIGMLSRQQRLELCRKTWLVGASYQLRDASWAYLLFAGQDSTAGLHGQVNSWQRQSRVAQPCWYSIAAVL